MPNGALHILATSYTPQELWQVAENAVLKGADATSLSMPLSACAPSAAAAMQIFGAIENCLAEDDGLSLDLRNDTPFPPDNLGSNTLSDLALAIYNRLVAQAGNAAANPQN